MTELLQTDSRVVSDFEKACIPWRPACETHRILTCMNQDPQLTLSCIADSKII